MKARRPKYEAPATDKPSLSPRPLHIVAVAELPTRFGDFRVVAFTPDAHGDENIAIVRGNVRGMRDVPARIHSECLTGDVLGSLRCDCRDQLTAALEQLGSLRSGALFYLRQEGRGIGLYDKLDAYALQDRGLDTYDANLALGHQADERDYTSAAQMLQALGASRIALLTNNPDKGAQLARLGVTIARRIPTGLHLNGANAAYLAAKAERGGHDLLPRDPERAAGPHRQAGPDPGPAPQGIADR
jgi:GTP cyclohydrolase II